MGLNMFAKLCGTKTQDMKVQEQNEGLLRGPKSDEFTMHLNRGQDDEMLVCCYKRSKFKLFITYFFIFATLGILRLVFHWIPHLYLLAVCTKCRIEEAEKLLITEVFNGKHKIYHVESLAVLTPESVAKLEREDNLLNHHRISITDNGPALSVHFENGEFREVDRLLLFTCKKVTYIWDSEKHEFIKLCGLDTGVSSEVFHKNKGLSSTEHFMRLQVYGPNKILVPMQSIVTLLCLEVLNPFYIFQILSFILWFCDNYYYYAAAIMLMAAYAVVTTVLQTRQNQRNLQSTCHDSDVCQVMRRTTNTNNPDGPKEVYELETVSTELLVPGDVIEIPSHGCTMHCDAVLLTGNCILNESMLTGESVPVTKTGFPTTPGIIYDSKEHARHTLFCGTQVIQTRYFGNEKVLALVIRTGFTTAKGNLVRSILYPPPVDFRFEKDSYKFVALLGLIACSGFFYTLVTKIIKGIKTGEIVLEAFDLITITVPPALPAAMTVGRMNAQKRLKNNQIFCISPRSINVSGSINCVCFDKTGTLTEDGLDLMCVVPVEGKRFKSPINNVESIPYNTFIYGLVSCHSLIIINKQIVGDPLDLKMFESTKWIMEEPEVADNAKYDIIYPTVFKPPKNRLTAHDQKMIDDLQIGVIKEFPFSSSSQRMGVIVRRLAGSHYEYYCKGSPEMILNFVRKESVPDDFSDVLESYTQEGCRVIALAHKILKMSYPKALKVQRETIEKDMDFLGLIVLENRLKPDTTPCIQMLNDAHIRVIMVTGDNILTALSVAKDCDIITPGQSVITVNCDTNEPPNLFFTLASMKNKIPNDVSILSNESVMSLETLESQLQTITTNSYGASTNTNQRPSLMLNEYRFAMTGKVWAAIREHYPELMPRICTRGNIFARMAPDQKQQLVQELQNLGYYVAMCGDGANDCGALRAAHTGISLSEAESSVASPFTSKNPNITCVLNVIKEGRAALVTSFGIFKYMAAYSLCQFISVLILYSIESNLTDMEFLYIDLAIISLFAFFFGKTEAYSGKLVKETPLSSLVSLSPVLSLLFQIGLVLMFQVLAFTHLQSEPWYIPLNSTSGEEDACVENYTLFTITSFQYIILAIVFSKGYPYRKSIFSNYGLMISTILMTSISIYLALEPADVIVKLMQLVLPESFNFRLYLLAYAGANFILSLLVEFVIVEKCLFERMRFKFHNVDKSKKKYLAVERDLNRDTKWPPLSSDFRSAASPMNPPPQTYTAQIVVEKENKFDRNHVLNKLYENSGVGGGSPSKSDVVDSPAKFHLQSPCHLPTENGFIISNEDLLFSSLPSENRTPTSPTTDTFKSLSNNTNYDLASSNLNIPELPYDGTTSNATPIHKYSTPMRVVQNDNRGEDSSLSNFNSFGASPPRNNMEIVKSLELNDLDGNR